MNKDIMYFKIKDISPKGIQYGFFSRLGGLSKKNYESLNCSLNSGDEKEKVIQNIELTKNVLDLKHAKIKFFVQNHGANVELVHNNNFDKKIYADGGITIDKNICLAILTADCAPIFLFDKNNYLICALHSGWKGCLGNIISTAVKNIKKIYKGNNDLIAIIGPCLNQENFEVDESFKKKFLIKNLEYEKFFFYDQYIKKIYFNMRGLIDFQLKQLSIHNIYHVKKDTYSEDGLFFSHRRATHKNLLPAGRMINIIGFKQ